MADKAFSIIGSIIVLATVTTLVMSGRNTAGVISSASNGLAANIRAAMGR